MMDTGFIKHIVQTELRWKLKYLNRSLFATVAALILLYTGGESVKNFSIIIFMFGAFLPMIASLQSSILPPMANQINQANQSGTFSWKYLHTVINDRKGFIFAFIITGIIGSLPTIVFVLGTLKYYKISFEYFFIGLIPFLLVVTFFRQMSIMNVIQTPRRVYFKYNPDEGLITFLKELTCGLIKGLQFFSYLGVCFLFVKFFYELSLIYGAVALIFTLIFINFHIYYQLISVWADERISNWRLSREKNKIIIQIILVLTFGIANNNYHGYIIENEDHLFDLIQDGKLVEFKSTNLKEKINKVQGHNGRFLIHEAVYRSKIDFVNYLLDQGSNLESEVSGISKNRFKYRNGMTPLMVALDISNNELSDLLIEKGANIEAVNEFGMTSLSLAAYRCNPVMMEKLIEKGADINKASDKGLTPLFYAVQGRCIVAVEYLKKVGASVDLKNHKKQTYIEYAKDKFKKFYSELEFYKDRIK